MKAFAAIVISALLLGCQSEQLSEISDNRDGAQSIEVPTGVAKALVIPLEGSTKVAPAIKPQFTDVSNASGIRFLFFDDIEPERYFLPEIMGGGVAWLDYDCDGWLDLYATNGCPLATGKPTRQEHASRLFRNGRSGEFADVSRAATLARDGYGQGCAVGDYNVDGFPDLYCSNYGQDTLLRNNGDGTFTDLTRGAEILEEEKWGASVAWFDAEGDGDLDLYVVNYLELSLATSKPCDHNGIPRYCGPASAEGAPDFVYINQGNGSFVESAVPMGFQAPNGKGLGVAILDLNDDLGPEVYVANDMTPNFLFTRSRNHPGQSASAGNAYVEMATAAGCAVSDEGEFEASMGIGLADYDRDGATDIYLTHYHSHKNTLYRNLGNLVFFDDSRRTRVAATSYGFLGFGTVAFDYDRDGWQDLIISNGHVLGPLHKPFEMTAQLLRNDGNGKFHDISQLAGPYFQELVLGRGIGSADYDNDGDLDFAVTHIGRPLALLRNDTNTDRNFVGLELRSESGLNPVGGRVVITAGKDKTVAAIFSGGSYLSSSDERLLFGVDRAAETVEVEIHWPSGRVDHLDDVGLNRYWFISEGDQPQVTHSAVE